MKWIDVKDELPSKSDGVLLWNGSEIDIYYYYIRADFEEAYKDVTHWMPLPEPPSL